MFGEVVCGDEGHDVGFEIFQVVVMVGLDRGVLDRAVHPLSLAVGPRVVRLGQPVLYGVCHADAVEDVRAEEAAAGALAILGQVGEGHAVVGEHGVVL